MACCPTHSLPDLRVQLMAALDTIQAWPSKGAKRKRDNDDALANIQNLLAQFTSDNEGEDNNEDDKDDKDEDEDKVTSWIDHWINKPSSEGGCRNTEERPGWGKPEILKTAGITDCQYNRYMV